MPSEHHAIEAGADVTEQAGSRGAKIRRRRNQDGPVRSARFGDDDRSVERFDGATGIGSVDVVDVLLGQRENLE